MRAGMAAALPLLLRRSSPARRPPAIPRLPPARRGPYTQDLG